jgi:putative Ca2+/H+ antiporter (TMEM165/GDT1 family)
MEALAATPAGRPWQSTGMKAYAALFLSIFLAEIGDKTQLATLLAAASPGASRLGVFLASAGALTLSSLIAVLLGERLGAWIAPHYLTRLAGMIFVALGAWMLWRG